jgi:ATP synthase protein I
MQPNDARIIRGAAAFTTVAGVVAVPLGAVVAGGGGALGVALGVLVAGLFFASGQYALVAVARRWPELFLGAGFLIYVTQVGVLLGVMMLLRDASFLNGRAFATGALLGLVAWLAGQIRANLKAKTAYVEPELAHSGPSARDGGDR